jgi:hypothetical protein
MGSIYICANRSHFNILVLKCLGFVESSRLLIVTPKSIMKLRFGLDIMPNKKLLGNFNIFFFLFCLILCN